MLAGCYPKGPEYVDDLDVTFTSYDESFNFQALKTYAIPDKIVIGFEVDKTGDTTIEYMNAIDANKILSQVNFNMIDYGWTKVDVDQNPDMLMMLGGISTTNYFYDYWYNWWYDDWYNWGWYYPPYVSLSSYTTGSLITVFADPNKNNPLNKVDPAWISINNGILTQGNDINRVLNAIDQSFEQSEYLKIN
jgi:hypothetical protein